MTPLSPFRLWQMGMENAMMLWDVQTVMALRLSGLAGLHTLPAGEASRMMSEKPPAFAQAFFAWQKALMSGGDWNTSNSAFTRPLAREARANRKRLTGSRRK
ncbi:antifreeze protein [Salipiger manganoxidans]|uniref:antifreeze protein n=1 Tax=Salipiger marinus TaxID=555512 RepID=UPI001E4D88A6|nr:antifreeze protein [Salipiger manganoxidans]MCD1617643.1 antifreeze protein [Salipiger manganoxidans]